VSEVSMCVHLYIEALYFFDEYGQK
jgi:hypothetical protein